ncbi:hypothetical protein F5Y19DRAFT_438230 [Xylariaceae sp. FL1651]|nr:hypothetical protein F5Y19DRAFT_438230 [Xylariaceae sp. FL1651]
MNTHPDTTLTRGEPLVSQLLLLRDDGLVADDTFKIGFPGCSKRKAEETIIDLDDVASTGDPHIPRFKRPRPGVLNKDTIVAKKLACPFFKRYKHSKGLSRSCMGPGWDSVSRVKEHLIRCHMQPKNQCNRCHQAFDSAASLVAHQRTLESCELQEAHSPQPPQTITEDQAIHLRHRGKRQSDANAEDKWQSMYSILFPDGDHVPSPYSDEPCGQCIFAADSYLLNTYRTYQLRELSPLVQRELAAIPAHEMSDCLRARIADILPRLNEEIFDDFQRSQGLISSTNSDRRVSPQRSMELADIERRTTQALMISPSHAAYDGGFSYDPLRFDINGTALDDFDFELGKQEKTS